MPEAIKRGADGQDYEQCLVDLKDKGDARYGICMKAYEAHHEKNDKGEWVRKKGHSKDENGKWTVNKEFAGFDDWVPIFQGGVQVDSQGNAHDGDELIDKAISSFAPDYHEPPVVVGHPKENSPAFGWVESIKKVVQTLKDGSKVNVLMARFKDVVPEFAQAVKQGIYKKRSASFYPDGRLRHVGFLGGMPPAVKGLADLKFSKDDKAIEFEESLDFIVGWWGIDRIAGLFRNIRDFFIEKFGRDDADEVLPTMDIDSIKESADHLSQIELPQQAAGPLYAEGGSVMPKSYTEDEMRAQLEAERARLAAEFAEKQKVIDEAAKVTQQRESDMADLLKKAEEAGERKAATLFAEQRRKDAEVARKKEISELISAGVSTGKILPAWVKMGLAQFMEALPAETPVSFGEGEGKIEKTVYEFFKSFMAEIPKAVNFGEFATRDKNVNVSGSAGSQLNDLTAKKMRENPALDYVTAFDEVQTENPQLVQEYKQEFSGMH